MKKWLKWTLGIVGVIIVVIVGFIAWNWFTFRIVSGTESLGSNISPIPTAEMTALSELNKGDTDWPSWYGPNGDHKSKVTGIKTDWSQGLSKVWEVNYLCQGNGSAAWSAPVIQGDRLIICGRDTDQDYVFCLNSQNGKLIWSKYYQSNANKSHGSGPRATPFIDDDRVYTFGRNGDLVCWNLYDGQKIWHKNVSDAGGKEPVWGHSSSPVVIDSLVLIQGGGDVRTIAYHKISGDIIWKSGKGLPGYAAIVPIQKENLNYVLAFHGTGLAALNTYTGENLWNIDWPTAYDVNATTPLVMDDFIFISSGYGTGSMLLKANGTQVDSVWRTDEFSAIHSDPYVIDSYLYGYSGDSFQNRGAFKCLDLSNGKEVWSTNDMGWGTCTWVDGYLLCCDIKGNIFLMQPSPDEFKLITELEDALGDIRGPVWTIPVVANDHLYLRFKQNLVCYNILN